MPIEGLTRPIIFFDLETTGLLVEMDRIIEIALLKIFPDGKEFRLTQRFQPGIKIPIESMAIHGISNEDLVGEPRFHEKAAELLEIFSECDLGGFAMQRLDIPILKKEFQKAGMEFAMEGRRTVDVSVIFREKERRNLTAAYKFYCGKDLVNAHSAQADNDATYEIFLAQLERYPDLPKNIEGLNAFCSKTDAAFVDREGKLIWRDGEAFFNFGKYRNRSLAEVLHSDSDYVDWIINKADFSRELINICQNAKQGNYPVKKGLK